jgi:hypothetical protein
VAGRLNGVATATVLAVVLVAALLGACSGDDDGGAGGNGGGGSGEGAAATTSTLDPLAETAQDRCGNDVTELTSTVWAIDPASGSVRWQASVPAAAGYLLKLDDNTVRVPLQGRSVDVELSAADGTVLGYPTAGVHEVLVDSNGVVTGTAGALVVDGEPQPPQVEVAGVRVETTDAGGALAVRGLDPATGAARWTSPLTGANQGQGASPPVVYGELVVVVGPAVDLPACS